MSNASRILATLDNHLSTRVELTLYGRAAIQLGFPNPPHEYALTHDVDAVLWLGQAEALNETTDFWQAVDKTNRALVDQELYVSHFFTEEQVVLRPCWRDCRVAITGQWKQLNLFRLGDVDLLLSKLMRDDPIDHRDARFIVRQGDLSLDTISEAIREARIPDNAEIRAQFGLASERLLSALH